MPSRGSRADVRLSETVRCARIVAKRAANNVVVYDDTLAGELARLRVLRSVRKVAPGLDAETLDSLVAEAMGGQRG